MLVLDCPHIYKHVSLDLLEMDTRKNSLKSAIYFCVFTVLELAVSIKKLVEGVPNVLEYIVYQVYLQNPFVNGFQFFHSYFVSHTSFFVDFVPSELPVCEVRYPPVREEVFYPNSVFFAYNSSVYPELGLFCDVLLPVSYFNLKIPNFFEFVNN